MGRKQFTKTVEVAEELESQKCKVTISGKEYLYEKGTSYQEIAKDFQKEYKHQIALVMLDGHRLQELRKQVSGDCTLQFITTQDTAGYDTYRRSVCFLFIKAVHDVIGHECPQQVRVRIHFSLGAGFYCTVEGIDHVGMEFQWKVEERMYELVQQRLPITKELIHTEEAVELFHRYGMFDKERLFRYRRSSHVNLYAMNEFRDYYYGYMMPDTGDLKYFALYLYQGGIVLQMPLKDEPEKVPLFVPKDKLFRVLSESVRWGDQQGIDTVGALNDMITQDDMREIVLVQEAFQERKIGEIAKQIADRQGVKFVLIAGPSSSGKTTFSHRLSIQLRVNGLHPHPISVDNYFVDREKTPKDEDGNYNFECIEAIDVEKFNEDMSNLLAGEEKAIVTDIAGTTRDVLEENLVLKGISLRILDTAGIRKTADTVEKIGVDRALEHAKDADLILYVVDASVPLDENDAKIMEILKGRKAIVLLNKSDLTAVIEKEEMEQKTGAPVISISAREETGMEELEEQMKKMFFQGEISFNDEVYITNARHKQALLAAKKSLELTAESIEMGMPEDFFSIDLMNAYEELGSIIGEAVGEDLVNEIFSKFCTGK